MAVSFDSDVFEKIEEMLQELSRFLDAAVDELLLCNDPGAVEMIEHAVAVRYSILSAFPAPLADAYDIFRHCELLASAASRWSKSAPDAFASRQELLEDLHLAVVAAEKVPERLPSHVTGPLEEALHWLREMLRVLQSRNPSEHFPAAAAPLQLKKKFLQNVAPEEPLEEYFAYLDLLETGLINALLEVEKLPPDREEAIEYLHLAQQNKQLFLQCFRAHAKHGPPVRNRREVSSPRRVSNL